MNPRYPKVCADIEKIREKMSAMQSKLRELERQKTEMENSDIVAAFRSTNITPQDLARYIQAFQHDGHKGIELDAMLDGAPTAHNVNLIEQEEASDESK